MIFRLFPFSKYLLPSALLCQTTYPIRFISSIFILFEPQIDQNKLFMILDWQECLGFELSPIIQTFTFLSFVFFLYFIRQKTLLFAHFYHRQMNLFVLVSMLSMAIPIYYRKYLQSWLITVSFILQPFSKVIQESKLSLFNCEAIRTYSCSEFMDNKENR